MSNALRFTLKSIYILAFSFILAPTVSFAYVANGHEYTLSCNENGYVLKSRYPVSRTVGQGAGTQMIKRVEKLYLGKNCDASHALLGRGTWCWANGGFVAEFKNGRFGFGRQELICDSNEDLGLSCRCQ